jgi:hypothetical protein
MKKQLTLTPGKELLIDLTLHAVSAGLIEDFAVQVVKPYYGGNLHAAIKDLMQRAVAEQEFLESHVEAG